MAAMMHAVAVKEGARSLSLQHHRRADRPPVITLPTRLFVLALVSLSPSSSYYVGRVATRKEEEEGPWKKLHPRAPAHLHYEL